MSPNVKPASPAQMKYLRDLAEQTATSFAYPKTSVQAKREIERLVELKAQQHETPLEPEEPVVIQGDAAAYRDDELSGYGASATWANSPSSAPATVELTRYTVRGAERIIYRQEVRSGVRLVDKPADGKGRSYLIDGELGREDEDLIVGIVRVYLEQARTLGAIPMATSAIGHELQQTAAA